MTQKVCRLPEVIDQTGLSRSSIYDKIREGNFPKQIKISKRAVGWLESDIDKWIDQQIQQTKIA